jgi:phenylacetate-CoA ligase
MHRYFSAKETQDPTIREQSLMARLPEFIAYAKQECAHYHQTLQHIDAEKITSRALLAQLPITRKAQLIELQSKLTPFAGITAKTANIQRVFQSPGPIFEPENTQDDWWRMGQAFFAAGFEQGDLVQNCLSYHLTPGGFILDSGARACGCSVIPAGPGQTEQQLELIQRLQPQGYCGTPSFLKILLDKAKQHHIDISCIKKALVTGEALPESLRSEFEVQNIQVLQAYASADVGLIGFESLAKNGFIISEEILVEIVRPGSLEPVAEGEIGEVVVTSFNLDYPLIRFATGDLSALATGKSACGRTNMRIKGWLGRADQTTKVKGMFVHPEQVEKIRQSFTEFIKVRLVVTQNNHNDVMQLQCELASDELSNQAQNQLIKAAEQCLKEVTKLSGSVIIVATNSLPNDGKVIEDKRVFN